MKPKTKSMTANKRSVSTQFAAAGCGGVALYSPRVAAMIASIAASRPPAKSPVRKRGVSSSSRMCLAVTSGSAPSSP